MSSNELPHLKDAALQFLRDPTNVEEVSKDKEFLSTLTKQGVHIVPAVLKGTAEVVPHPLIRKRKRPVECVVIGSNRSRFGFGDNDNIFEFGMEGGHRRRTQSYSGDLEGVTQLYKTEGVITRKTVALTEQEELHQRYRTLDQNDRLIRETERLKWKKIDNAQKLTK